jgi:hypothetical protein
VLRRTISSISSLFSPWRRISSIRQPIFLEAQSLGMKSCSRLRAGKDLLPAEKVGQNRREEVEHLDSPDLERRVGEHGPADLSEK